MNFNITTLPNGLRVVSSKRPEIETVSLGVWVKTGSACETEELNGISHFLEHMVFKGTQKRNLVQISEEVEDVGGQINAYTSREFTSFYAKMLKADVELAMDVIADILQNSTFPEAELLKERDVVIQEIKQSIDTPDDIIFDYLQETAFPNQAIGRPILGPEEKVRTFTADHLNSYLKTNYAAENMLVCAVGNIEHDDFVKIVSNRFSELQSKVSFVHEDQIYQGGFTVESRDIEQAHILLGFRSFPYYDKRYYPCMILSNILGGATSSRLFQEIREKRGLVYSIYSFANSHTQSGLLGIYAGTGRNDIKALMPVVCDEIRKLCDEKVDEKELSRAKIQMKAGMMMALESSSSVAEVLARQILIYNKAIPIDEMVERINAVTLDDIQSAAQHIFSSNPCYNLIGAVENYVGFDEFKSMLKR